MKIGVFDSGMGGFLILDALTKVLPEYDYVFYGDTKNLPYGEKSEEEVLALSRKAFKWLFDRDVALVIVACNSVSSSALESLTEDLKGSDKNTFGVILPTVEEVKASGLKDVLLIATTHTINSKKYDKELVDSSVALTSIPTPSLASLIEGGKYEEAVEVASEAISKGESEGVILGCTHYSKIKDDLRARFPDKKFFSQDEIIPNTLINYLNNNSEISEKLSRGGGVQCYRTGKLF
ncbi:MAG: glutamate racemase [Patescibacteria group bacterium UBA2103]